MLPDHAAHATPKTDPTPKPARRRGGFAGGRTAACLGAGALALAAAGLPRPAAACVVPGGRPVIVTGTMMAAPHTLPTVGQRSAARYELRLSLDAPLCVGEETASLYSSAGVLELTEIEIVYGDAYRFSRAWLRRHVSVTGQVVAPADGGSTPVAIAARETHILAGRQKGASQATAASVAGR